MQPASLDEGLALSKLLPSGIEDQVPALERSAAESRSVSKRKSAEVFGFAAESIFQGARKVRSVDERQEAALQSLAIL